MFEAIYAAFFEQGEDIGRLDTLAHIAAARGLDAELVERDLAGDAGREAVLADVRLAEALDIRAAPFFVVDGRYAVSGAQPPEVLRSALERAATGT
jgi:predicted DsbA family dithiol-disulfide isomerase